MPSREFEVVLQLLEARASERQVSEQDLVTRRRELDDLGALSPIPDDVLCTRLDLAGLTMAQLSPIGADGDRSLLYLHGGGYCRGSIDSHAGFASRLARAARADVYLPDYRLAPEHRFPAALHDALATYRWMTGALGIPAGSIALVGDSAGGGLVVATLLALRAGGDALPASAALISPWLDLRTSELDRQPSPVSDPVISATDLSLSTDWYLGTWSPDDPLVSPVLADLRGLPPLLVHVGTRELLLHDARSFEAAAGDQGADVQVEVHQDMVHCWHLFMGTPESDAGIADIAAFLEKHWAGSRHASGGDPTRPAGS